MLPKHVQRWGTLASFLAACMCVPAAAQVVQEDERLRLASREEGEAVVQAAWELRRGLIPKPDCSHFVNAVYAQAGLDYAYAPAGDIFDGIDSFRRVQRPQPGDLVAWRGHTGIVVDPDEHSFYSSVLSGFAIEDYRSNYWAVRGRPRFYRYVIDDVHGARALAHLGAKQDIPALKQQSVSDGRLTGERGLTAPDSTAIELSAANTTRKLTSNDAETMDVVPVSVRTKPSKDEVLAAAIRLADITGERLLQGMSLDSRPTVAVVDQFTVVEVSTNERSGWAELEVREAASIQYGFADLKQATGKWRVALRHEDQGWVLLARQDRIYLRRDLAVTALANQLAILSRVPANGQELRKVVRVLDELLAEKPPTRPLPARASSGTAGTAR